MPAPTTRQLLNRDAIRALFWIIITALTGIIITTLAGVMLRAGLFGTDTSIDVGSGDEALSILGNVASAAIGGLVGWLTRDYAETSSQSVDSPAVPGVPVGPIQASPEPSGGPAVVAGPASAVAGVPVPPEAEPVTADGIDEANPPDELPEEFDDLDAGHPEERGFEDIEIDEEQGPDLEERA